jgi:predicted HAD superfamily Cof-like phosphohydrolase
MKTYFVYLTTNNTNGKKYIGLTYQDIDTGYLGSGTAILRAIKKYGKESFTRVNLHSGLTLEQASELEKNTIKEHDAQNSREYYNFREGGCNGDEGTHHPDSIKKMSKKCKAAWQDKRDMYLKTFANRDNTNIGKYDRDGEKNPMYGKNHTDESRKQMSEKKKGIPLKLTEEQRAKRSAQAKNNPVLMGKKSPLQKARNRWAAIRKTFSKDPVVSDDMKMMHDYYGIRTRINELSKEELMTFLKFRFDFLEEELTEGREAIANNDAEEIVDSLIDLVVVAVGTIDLFDVDFKDAWYKVLEANMTKEVGINESRDNPLGLPDLVKPSSWKNPSHEGNHGLLKDL